ncbi:MAG: hypothetical protein ACLR3C_14355 [Eggerthella lenta]
MLYLGLGILFEYGMGIPMGFYNIPVVVIFLVALLVACFQNRKLPFDDKLTIMAAALETRPSSPWCSSSWWLASSWAPPRQPKAWPTCCFPSFLCSSP